MAQVIIDVPSGWARRSSTVQGLQGKGLQGKGLEDVGEEGRAGAAL